MTDRRFNYGWVDSGLEVPGQSSWQEMKISKRGETRIIDFISEMLQEGRCYQVRLGTVTTPIGVDVVMSDAKAELCYDALAGLTIIPIDLGIAARSVATAIRFGAHLKGVGEVSSAGTAFAPLPLLQGGDGASGSARAAGDGGVTVKAELVTDTVRIWEFTEEGTQTLATYSGLENLTGAAQNAKLHYVGKGPACIYLQLASTTAVTLAYSHLSVMELLSTSIG